MLRQINEIKPQGLTKGARFLFDLYWTTYQALADAAGKTRALELVEPYLKFHADAAIQILKDHYKFKAEDPFSMAAFIKFIGYITGVCFRNEQFFDQGFTADVTYCPFTNLSEALCFMNEFLYNYYAEAMNNNYEYIATRMLVKGDPCCQGLVKKKGHEIWGDVSKKAAEVPILELSYEEREFWSSANYSQIWIYITNALVDFAGKEKSAEILRPYMWALGKSISADILKELSIKDRDATSMALIIDQCNCGTNQKGEYLIHTPEKVERKITECIFAHASQDICADALEARANGICEAINPDYEFHLTKRMCKGDKTCHWVVKKK